MGTATLFALRGQLGCRLSRAESQALSTGVTTRPQGLSEAGGLQVGWGRLTISGPSPRTRLIVLAQLGFSPGAHRRPHSGGSDPTLSSRPHPHVGSRSTGHMPLSCSLSLPFHTHMRGLHIGCLGCGATVNSDVFCNKWHYSF